MNRREFTRNALAAAALPVVPLPAFASPAPAASTATAARFWAIYMTHLHGKFTPQMLSKTLNLDIGAAKAINAQLVADKVITPAQAAGRVMARSAVSHKPASGFRERLNSAFDTLTGEDEDEMIVEETRDEDLADTKGDADEQA